MTEQKIVKSQRKSKIKIGDKFGRLVVLKNVGIVEGNTCFRCECVCKNIRIVRGCDLYREHTRSCGCLQRENRIKHNMAGTPEYDTWVGIIQRCTNPNSKSYKNYGERGITVCTEWLHSFKAFFQDMGRKPKGLTIERINNELGYFKENCRWATYSEQNTNQRIKRKNKVGITGVSWSKQAKKYHVQIAMNYKRYHIGYFKNLEDARAARIAAEQKYQQ